VTVKLAHDGGGVFSGDRQGRHRADWEHAAGVPQHGHPWLRCARRRQARVHGALLQRQGQVGLAACLVSVTRYFLLLAPVE